MKKIKLTLFTIEYTGDSVGENIRIEIKILDKVFSIDRTIKSGETAQLNQEIGTFTINQDSLDTEIHIKVIEKDLVWSDKGSVKERISLSPLPGTKQQLGYKIQVRERRRILGKAIANFYLTLEAENVSIQQGQSKSVQKRTLQPYKSNKKDRDYNRFDDQIIEIVNKWNDEFASQKYPPPVPLDPNLVKAMIFIESTMGYGTMQAGREKDVMQVGHPNDPALHTLNNDGWIDPSTGRIAREREWINGKETIIDYDGEANAETTYESIKWGVRWLYHKAQSIEGKKRVWRDWKDAVKRYGPAIPKDEYSAKVYKIYQKGIEPRTGFKLWSILLWFALAFTILDGAWYAVSTFEDTELGSYLENKIFQANAAVRESAEGKVNQISQFSNEEWEPLTDDEAVTAKQQNAKYFEYTASVAKLSQEHFPAIGCIANNDSWENYKNLQNCSYTVGSNWSDFWTVKLNDGGYGFIPIDRPNYQDYENVGPYSVSFDQHALGDLDEDGRQDAVVVLAVSYGRGFYNNLIALMQDSDGKYKQVANYMFDYKEEVRGIVIDRGIIIVHAILKADDDPVCCASVYDTLRFKLAD